jgi:hypothetical protein
MKNEQQLKSVKDRFEKLTPFLNERQKRLMAATEAKSIGYGGISTVARSTGLSRATIAKGCRELETAVGSLGEKIRARKIGGGRKKEVVRDNTLKRDLESLIDPFTRGDPESPLRWTAKSVRRLAAELRALGHHTSHHMVANLLHEMEYSLQSNRKTKEGSCHPDRNQQFEYISRQVQEYQLSGQPIISVDAKKRELIGNFKNNGQELRPKGKPEEVNVYDFERLAIGKVSPYGVYDISKNEGWVSVGVDHNTAQFAVESIRTWWYAAGKENYPHAKRLMITADCGGSNGARVRLWKLALQRFANEAGLEIHVCHFPPGTSKWNKVEHRLFSFISQNWRGKPLTTYQVVVDLIANTTTKTGLKVRCKLDESDYPVGIKVSKNQMQTVNLIPDSFHSDWNYSIVPQQKVA